MPMVLFNVGWMIDYQGQSPDDPIVGGGANDEKLEDENFLPLDGRHYGFGQSGSLDLGRIGQGVEDDADYLDDVTVVFVATRPEERGRVVVGWYRNARVWRNPRQRPSPGHGNYFARARTVDCTLLAVDERRFEVPQARQDVFGMGKHNIRYTLDKKGENDPLAEDFVRRLEDYIEGFGPEEEPASMPLNTILYGPPGTGKTYATARRCVEICDGPAERPDEEVRERYRRLVNQGRVEFITFHQSYGYEEFVEGLRPDTGGDEEENGDGGPGFRLVATDGVIKRIAERARKVASPAETNFDLDGRRIFKMGLGDPADREQHGIFDECIENGYVLLGYGGDVDWSEGRFDQHQEILARWQEDDPDAKSHNPNVMFMRQFRAKMNEGDLVIVPRGLDRFRAVGEVTGPYQFVPRDDGSYPHRRAVEWRWHDAGEGMPVSEIYDRSLVRPTIYELNRRTVCLERLQGYLGPFERSKRRLPHVLVIDEINRANISKVMGEFVTLLEEDKREGAENEVALTLPHSRKRFTLPSNLHIVGTMNTADRSIALLDTALRRRFDFEELPPDYGKLREAARNTDIDLPSVLRSMNERLEWLIDRDHLIGHAWLMGARTREDVDRVMRRKIIPLVAEYFYDDWEKVRAVLGGTGDFVRRKALRAPPGVDDPGEDRYRWAVRKSFKGGAYKRLVAGAAAFSGTG